MVGGSNPVPGIENCRKIYIKKKNTGSEKVDSTIIILNIINYNKLFNKEIQKKIKVIFFFFESTSLDTVGPK